MSDHADCDGSHFLAVRNSSCKSIMTSRYLLVSCGAETPDEVKKSCAFPFWVQRSTADASCGTAYAYNFYKTLER